MDEEPVHVDEIVFDLLEQHLPVFNFMKLNYDKCSCGFEYEHSNFIQMQHAAHLGMLIQQYINDAEEL